MMALGRQAHGSAGGGLFGDCAGPTAGGSSTAGEDGATADTGQSVERGEHRRSCRPEPRWPEPGRASDPGLLDGPRRTVHPLEAAVDAAVRDIMTFRQQHPDAALDQAADLRSWAKFSVYAARLPGTLATASDALGPCPGAVTAQ
ncbi:hypothetical protein [Cryobacterium sp. CG_9.6]|uniref:hypothetical protein n=1 Tax=Cryobacterium sp. CG_9.6 TaxID=2760710 RepID=UPI0024769446|nr:hypothetical protein [Cryobacterium sp. CG_9.6]MDH6236373.1 hypothetical protein [Cryobacterium sp. CG_9.6]